MVHYDPAKEKGEKKAMCADLYSWASDACSGLFRRGETQADSESSSDEEISEAESSPIFVERFMAWYARMLMRPKVRNAVILFCLALFGVCLYGTSQLSQKFDPQDYVPDDSFIQGFFDSCKSQEHRRTIGSLNVNSPASISLPCSVRLLSLCTNL